MDELETVEGGKEWLARHEGVSEEQQGRTG
jgi:hypothetical protein